MRVWQPGSHLSMERGARVADWSWRQTARRLRTLAMLAAPYKLQTALAIGSLLAATGTALAPPFLAKLAIDDGIRRHDLTHLGWIVAAFLAAGLANWGTSCAQTYFTGWTGERILADLRNRRFRHLQRLSLRRFREVNETYREANQRTVLQNGLYFPFVDFLSSVATAVVLGYGGYLVFGGSLTVGTLFAFLLYLSNFFDPVQQLSQLYNTFLSAVAALDKITEVLDEEPEIVDRPGSIELPRIEGHVRFEDVRFGYGKGPEVLHGISLDVPAGTTVALVGHTGAGKSTIAKLLARFYEPRAGRITIDAHGARLIEAREE